MWWGLEGFGGCGFGLVGFGWVWGMGLGGERVVGRRGEEEGLGGGEGEGGEGLQRCRASTPTSPTPNQPGGGRRTCLEVMSSPEATR